MKRTAAGNGAHTPPAGQPLDHLVDAYLNQQGPRASSERDDF